ncbi:hypothetical protein BDU57DRAFT_512092 [Ampelomyces quisqualis]|uniref:Uncharacterized protein n=1 Tax=Ampelomyces quisqualis TaxID=50730 RepID=A0A6A5QUV9_AMPQU|nr:hypothetical protein BDU57DRAFT_512092 [Ampelomyces quisqualis]
MRCRDPSSDRSTMKSFSLAVLGFASLTLCAPGYLETPQPDLQATIERYVFNIPIDEFIKNRKDKIGPPELDWSSDGCPSGPDDSNLKNSC